jgi:hypothetical protein
MDVGGAVSVNPSDHSGEDAIQSEEADRVDDAGAEGQDEHGHEREPRPIGSLHIGSVDQDGEHGA